MDKPYRLEKRDGITYAIYEGGNPEDWYYLTDKVIVVGRKNPIPPKTPCVLCEDEAHTYVSGYGWVCHSCLEYMLQTGEGGV